MGINIDRKLLERVNEIKTKFDIIWDQVPLYVFNQNETAIAGPGVIATKQNKSFDELTDGDDGEGGIGTMKGNRAKTAAKQPPKPRAGRR